MTSCSLWSSMPTSSESFGHFSPCMCTLPVTSTSCSVHANTAFIVSCLAHNQWRKFYLPLVMATPQQFCRHYAYVTLFERSHLRKSTAKKAMRINRRSHNTDRCGQAGYWWDHLLLRCKVDHGESREGDLLDDVTDDVIDDFDVGLVSPFGWPPFQNQLLQCQHFPPFLCIQCDIWLDQHRTARFSKMGSPS